MVGELHVALKIAKEIPIGFLGAVQSTPEKIVLSHWLSRGKVEDELKKLSAMREQLFNIKIQMKMLKNIQGITYNLTLFTYLVQKKEKKLPLSRNRYP